MTLDTKLIFFDMEGTIFQKNCQGIEGDNYSTAWTAIAHSLGPEALKEELETQRKWRDGEYVGYMDWMKDNMQSHKNHRLTKDVFTAVINSFEYHPGVVETFEKLSERGIKTALISGGFKEQANRVQTDLKIGSSFAACEYFWNDQGKLLHWNLLPCDWGEKVDFMEAVRKDHKIGMENCAFVGDGANDLYLAQAVRVSIAFNAHPDLQSVATYSINQKDKKDFRAVLQYL